MTPGRKAQTDHRRRITVEKQKSLNSSNDIYYIEKISESILRQIKRGIEMSLADVTFRAYEEATQLPNKQNKKQNKTRTRVFSKSEIEKMLDSVRWDSTRYTAFLIGKATGCRVQELQALRVKDVLPDENIILVWDVKKSPGLPSDPRPDMKTKHLPGSKYRRVPVHRSDIGDIIRYVRDNKLKPNDYIIKRTAKTINRWIKDAVMDCNIYVSPNENARWHSFRGSYITRMHEKGATDKFLMEITGDAYTTLLEYYTAPTPESIENEATKLFDEDGF